MSRTFRTATRLLSPPVLQEKTHMQITMTLTYGGLRLYFGETGDALDNFSAAEFVVVDPDSRGGGKAIIRLGYGRGLGKASSGASSERILNHTAIEDIVLFYGIFQRDFSEVPLTVTSITDKEIRVDIPAFTSFKPARSGGQLKNRVGELISSGLKLAAALSTARREEAERVAARNAAKKAAERGEPMPEKIATQTAAPIAVVTSPVIRFRELLTELNALMATGSLDAFELTAFVDGEKTVVRGPVKGRPITVEEFG